MSLYFYPALSNLVIRGLKKFEDIPGPPCWPLVGSALMYRFGDFKKTQYHEAIKGNSAKKTDYSSQVLILEFLYRCLML